MSHKALARKYRPKSFADVATQEHVSETLRRAVATERVGHAYLFCGPRGVGKTTLARVLAMALNCPNRTEEGEPCGACDSCARIWGGHTALDVVEIDAASNRGVDDARDLRERAMYAPSAEGRSKVYIVDEAHMLTREAWNALLKILEEPPPRVIFVFATTEPQKIQQVAAPILSRCQRFDFRRIGVGDIVTRLESVLVQEGAVPVPDALRLIARKADGGMRDALSVLDQVMSLTGGEVDTESVIRVLGLVEDERYLELLDILRDGHHEAIFGLIQALVDDGYDLVEFYHGLLDVLRALLRLRLSPDADLDVRSDIKERLIERASAFEPGDLVRMLTSAADLESQGSLRRSPNPRLPIEMLLLRMSFLDRTVAFEELIQALGGAPRPAGEGVGGGSGGSGEAVRASAASADASPSDDAARAGPRSGATSTVASDTGTEAPSRSASAGPGTHGTSQESERQDHFAASPRPDEPNAAEAVGNGPLHGTAGDDRSRRDAAAGDPPDAAGDERVLAEVAGRPPVGALEAWERWLEDGRTVPRGLGPFLRSAEVRESESGALTVVPLPGPAIERLQQPAVLDEVRRGVANFLGRAPDLTVEAIGVDGEKPRRVTRNEVRDDTLKALFRQEPRLQRAVEELDLELMD